MSEEDEELRRRLELLKAQFEQGKISIAPHLSVKESLLAVRYGPDGQIDLSTVDGAVRSMAMIVSAMKDREDLKGVASLRAIQEAYFKVIELNFGSFFREMRRQNATPHQLGMSLSRDRDTVDEIYKSIPEFLGWVKEFWKSTHDIASAHVLDMRALKAVFGGAIHPEETSNIASSSGIYVDTIVLPDPFLRSEMYLNGKSKEDAVYYLVKSAAAILEYKELALADVTPAIVTVLPDERFADPDAAKFLIESADKDVLSHVNRLLGRKFSKLDEAFEFVLPLSSVPEVLEKLKDRKRLIFATEDNDPVEEQFNTFLNSSEKLTGERHAGKGLVFHSIGRMRQANDVLYRAQSLGGVPLIDAPTSWLHFQWKLEYGVERIGPERLHELHMCKALQAAATGEMTWLGNVPSKALIEIRKQGAIAELRKLLFSGIDELVLSNPTNFYRTGDKVVENLQKAFDAHTKELQTLSAKKWRFAGVDLSMCLVRGAVEIASACGVPGVSLINAAINETSDQPKLKDLPAKFRAIKAEDERIKTSPVGLLFQHAKKVEAA